MKQIKLIIFVLTLLISHGVKAQTSEGITQSVIIADALAQLPANSQKDYNQIIGDLVSTGEGGLLELISRLNSKGNENKELLEFAVSGWTSSVSNDKVQRVIAAGAFTKVLKGPADNEVKAYVIRQLRRIASDKEIDIISDFLDDDYLRNDAAQVLVSINSEKANEALLNALRVAKTEHSRINIINALAQSDYKNAEPVLLDLLQGNSGETLQKVILNALSSLGTKESLKAMRKAVVESNYSYGKNNSVSSYIGLLDRLNNSEPKLVNKEAHRLLSIASKKNNDGLKSAASILLLKQGGKEVAAVIERAFKDGSVSYISSLLNAFPFEKDKNANNIIMEELKSSSSPDIQATLINWLSRHSEKTDIPIFIGYINSPNKDVQKAAVMSLAQIGGDNALASLAGLLKNDSKETILLAYDALTTFEGDLSNMLASVFNDCNDEGKKAILKLISARKIESQYDLVYNQLFVNDTSINLVAAETLKDVVTAEKLPDLFNLVEQVDDNMVPFIQQAMNKALSQLSADEQIELIITRMDKSTNKHLYYRAPANSETSQSLDMLYNAYNNEGDQNRIAALEALTSIKSFNVVYPLLNIARKTSEKQELKKLSDALVSLIVNSQQTEAVKYLFLREVMQFAHDNKQKNEILKHIGATGQYQAMLFAAPFMNDPETSESAALAIMNIAINEPSFAGKSTAGILEKVIKTLSNPDADYQRQSIRKYLSENSDQGGYVPIFNGKDLKGWKGLVGNPIKRSQMSKNELEVAQQKADKQASESWTVKDGVLLFNGKGNNLCTEKQYGDFDMLIDWKLYEGSEPDAGIYLRGTPQVQIWDTARVKVGAQVGSGGLYNNKQNPSNPLKVADLKLEEWNTLRIRMIGDRVSVWLNGELVTDNTILENFWDPSQPIFPMEQIELQAHGSKVEYRDIYIRELERPEPFVLSEEEVKEGFEILFDGTNMHQWTGNTTDYIIEDGVMAVYPTKKYKGSNRNLYTKKEYGNFIFRFEFMLTSGANNGLGIRTPMEGDAAYMGMELQILDNDSPIYEKLQIYQYHGSVYGIIPAKRGFLKPLGEWNYQEVIVDGDQIKVNLNGTTILDGNIRDATKNGTADGKDHPGLFNKKGHIGFLGHGTIAKFKNIRVKAL